MSFSFLSLFVKYFVNTSTLLNSHAPSPPRILGIEGENLSAFFDYNKEVEVI